MYDYLSKLSNCNLCAWKCGVDRLSGERGVCGITLPKVSTSMLHPAPPSSYDAFLTGCNFRCLFCQNWTIANYPDNPMSVDIEGYHDPKEWAERALLALKSEAGRLIKADRVFFTGGEPTCSLPWVEQVVKEARKMDPNIKVNFDTNGYLSPDSLRCVLDFTTSITYDIKAYNEKTFQALTGAPVEPVLRNVEYLTRHAPKKIWEFRIMVIPDIHETEIPDLCEFLAGLDPTLPISFLAFRPNFIMECHPGPSKKLMEWCVQVAKDKGLVNVGWAGVPGINGEIPVNVMGVWKANGESYGWNLAGSYAREYGCKMVHRSCGICDHRLKCDIKRYVPSRKC